MADPDWIADATTKERSEWLLLCERASILDAERQLITARKNLLRSRILHRRMYRSRKAAELEGSDG